MITKNESLTAIFLFELKESIKMLLFSRAALKLKLITTMYTDVKVDDHHQVDHAVSAQIITADKVTKTPIGKIDNFFFEVSGIIAPIKTDTTQLPPLIKFDEEEKKPIWKAYQVLWANTDHNNLPPVLT
ncbi:hypothetical protein G9A89_021792 [Geosiphon pyriformis]|nr:hypothetical protein G9A89_021792 [Geosiphon pyriformis]